MGVINGERLCARLFRCIVEKGESVKYNEVRKIYTTPSDAKQQTAAYPIYRKNGLPDEPVEYTDEPGMVNVGKVIVETPGHGSNREAEVSFTFGGTEIIVQACDRRSGKKASISVDFLT